MDSCYTMELANVPNKNTTTKLYMFHIDTGGLRNQQLDFYFNKSNNEKFYGKTLQSSIF